MGSTQGFGRRGMTPGVETPSASFFIKEIRRNGAHGDCHWAYHIFECKVVKPHVLFSGGLRAQQCPAAHFGSEEAQS